MNKEISIVIVTIGRQSLLRAVASVFAQQYDGNIQIVIGFDIDAYGQAGNLIKKIMAVCPSNMFVTWINLGYSTSKRHGGVHDCFYGGSLRTALTFLAKSEYVMYLDDDDWLGPSHCEEVMGAIQNKNWAFANSYYADGNLSEPICVDLLESVGVNKGIFKERFGGFVRPSGLLINKIKLSHILHLWSESAYKSGDGEDRLIFARIKNLEHGFTGKASVYYSLDPKDHYHRVRLEYIKGQGKSFKSDVKLGSVRE
jgi:glycosyltransferase involved in cell wall biosynthesis